MLSQVGVCSLQGIPSRSLQCHPFPSPQTQTHTLNCEWSVEPNVSGHYWVLDQELWVCIANCLSYIMYGAAWGRVSWGQCRTSLSYLSFPPQSSTCSFHMRNVLFKASVFLWARCTSPQVRGGPAPMPLVSYTLCHRRLPSESVESSLWASAGSEGREWLNSAFSWTWMGDGGHQAGSLVNWRHPSFSPAEITTANSS